jgi:phosphatidate cytidylyltransferase
MSDPASTSTPPSKARIFVRRLFSSVVLWTVVISALFSGHKWISDYVFLAIMMGLAGFGLAEFYGMVEKRGLPCFKEWGIFGGLLLMLGCFFYLSESEIFHIRAADANDLETGFLILLVLGLCIRRFLSKATVDGMVVVSTTLFGFMYVPWLLNFVQKINYFPHVDGRYYVLYFVLVTKFSDIGAYCVGSLIGRHKMIPRISPGKTWEGFGGALLVSVLVSLVFAHLTRSHMAGMTVVHALVLGVVLGGTAVVGDLIESLFKREAGIKDSGRFFPGIGGILDLLDSLLFNAPLMYLYLRYVIQPGYSG